MNLKSRTSQVNLDALHLTESWKEYRLLFPNAQAHDAAKALNVSEAELVASNCGYTTTRLTNNWPQILMDLTSIGCVTALTNNNHVNHKLTGIFRNLQFHEDNCLAFTIQQDFQLLLFLEQWFVGFSVVEKSPTGGCQSLQFFDYQGIAVHKIYTTADSDEIAFRKLVNKHKATDQSTVQPIYRKARSLGKENQKIDSTFLRKLWKQPLAPEQCTQIIRDNGINEVHALRSLGSEFAIPVPPDLFSEVMTKLAILHLELDIVVRNPGAVQTYKGNINNIQQKRHLFNILDDHFSLHLNENESYNLWVVTKPLSDRSIVSLQLYDIYGENMISIYDLHDGCPNWCKIMASLPGLEDVEELLSQSH